MKKSVVLVTGATGLIGSHLVRHLWSKGEKVIASNVLGSLCNLEGVRLQTNMLMPIQWAGASVM